MAKEKPALPRANFPLKPHPNGQGGVRFKLDGQWRWKYFGPWEDAQGAEARYEAYRSGATVDKPKAPAAKHPRTLRKPNPHFPLFAHANGQWAKKIRGRLHYFGSLDNPDAALEKFLDVKDNLLAGRTPMTARDGTTIRELLNRFLSSKERLLGSGDIVQRTFNDYKTVTDRIAKSFDISNGLVPGVLWLRRLSPAGARALFRKWPVAWAVRGHVPRRDGDRVGSRNPRRRMRDGRPVP